MASGAGASADQWPEVSKDVRDYARGVLVLLIEKLGLDVKQEPAVGSLLPKTDADALDFERAEITSRNQATNAFSALWAAGEILKQPGSPGKRITDGLARIIRAEMDYLSSIAWGRAPVDAASFNGQILPLLFAVSERLPEALDEAAKQGQDKAYALGYHDGINDVQAWAAAGSTAIVEIFRAWERAASAPVRAPIEVAEHVYDRAKEELKKGREALGEGLAGLFKDLQDWLNKAGKYAAAGAGIALFLLLGLGLAAFAFSKSK